MANKKCLNTKFDPDDLLNELVIYLHENELKVMEVISNKQSKKDPLLRFCNNWLYNSTNFKPNKYATNFTSKFLVKEKIEIDNLPMDKHPSDINVDESIVDIQDLTDDGISKIVFIRRFRKNLNQFEQVLFQLHFIENLPHYKISDRLTYDGIKTSPSSIYNLLLELRQKIKQAYEDNRI